MPRAGTSWAKPRDRTLSSAACSSGPPPSVAAYVDLSLPLVNAAGYNTHPDAVALSAATDAIGPSGIGFKGYVVLKGTEVVAERYDVGDATSTYQIFSCTKSWAATMIGELLYAGQLTLSTKLEDIFTTLNWDTVNGGAKKRLITVEQLLTMSSGLTEPICGLGGATATLVATLSQGFVIDEQVGSFQYVCTQKILAWIIYEKSGLTSDWLRCFSRSACPPVSSRGPSTPGRFRTRRQTSI